MNDNLESRADLLSELMTLKRKHAEQDRTVESLEHQLHMLRGTCDAHIVVIQDLEQGALNQFVKWLQQEHVRRENEMNSQLVKALNKVAESEKLVMGYRLAMERAIAAQDAAEIALKVETTPDGYLYDHGYYGLSMKEQRMEALVKPDHSNLSRWAKMKRADRIKNAGILKSGDRKFLITRIKALEAQVQYHKTYLKETQKFFSQWMKELTSENQRLKKSREWRR